jgi:hypothetical protein
VGADALSKIMTWFKLWKTVKKIRTTVKVRKDLLEKSEMQGVLLYVWYEKTNHLV